MELDDPNGAASNAAPKSDLGRRSSIGILIMTASQASRFVINFGSMIILARLLQPWQFGLVAMVTPMVSFLYVFADLGLAQTVVQRPDLSELELSSLFWVVVAVTSLLSLIFAGISPVVSAFYHEPKLAMIFLCFSPIIAFSGLAIVPRAMLTRDGQFKLLAVIDVASALAGAAAGIGGALTGARYWALVFPSWASMIVATILCWIFCPWRPLLKLDWRLTSPLMGAGGYVASANLGTLLTATIDNVLIGAVLGKGALGYYDQGYRLVTQSVAQLLTPLTRVMTPMLIKSRHLEEDYSATFFTLIRGQCLLLWPGLVIAIVHAREIIPIVVGSQWGPAAPVLAWFCLSAMASPLFTSAGWLLLAEGRLRAYSFTSLFGSAATAAAVIAGLLQIGGGGVSAIARDVALAYAVVITPVICVTATVRGPVGLAGFCRAIATYLAAAVIVYTGARYGHLYQPANALYRILLGAVESYVVFIIVALFSAQDRAILEMAVKVCRDATTRRVGKPFRSNAF